MAKQKAIRDVYFDWLVEKAGLDKNNYYMLLSSMHAYPFTPIIDMDENREMDGEALRSVFVEEYLRRYPPDKSVFPLSEIQFLQDEIDDAFSNAVILIHNELNQKCSMLEMLVALSRRMAYFVPSVGTPKKNRVDAESVDEETAKKCFKGFIRNLDLMDITDEAYPQVKVRNKFSSVMNKLSNRAYEASGKGGLFPLRHPACDQRKTEIWYQMQAYILEQYEEEYRFDG